jgi:hypothetical protein
MSILIVAETFPILSVLFSSRNLLCRILLLDFSQLLLEICKLRLIVQQILDVEAAKAS